MLHVNPHILTLLSGVILPFLVAVVTKKHASSSLKAAVLAVLSVAAAVVAVFTAGHGAVTINQLVDATSTAFGAAAVTYFGIYKPAGLTALVQTLTHDFGLGSDLRTEWTKLFEDGIGYLSQRSIDYLSQRSQDPTATHEAWSWNDNAITKDVLAGNAVTVTEPSEPVQPAQPEPVHPSQITVNPDGDQIS